MSAVIRPIADIDRRARRILTRNLGIVDTLRLLGRIPFGFGRLHCSRKGWLHSLSLEEIVSEIKGKRGKGTPNQAMDISATC